MNRRTSGAMVTGTAATLAALMSPLAAWADVAPGPLNPIQRCGALGGLWLAGLLTVAGCLLVRSQMRSRK